MHLRSSFVAATLLTFLACGDDGQNASTGSGGGGGQGGVDDGKYHPEPNGQVTDEASACSQLQAAFSLRFTQLQCSGTTRTCPALLRFQFPECMSYDLGTVFGCATYYGEQVTCEELTFAIDNCVVSPIDGTEGQGCP
jgi:hypothetical protein